MFSSSPTIPEPEPLPDPEEGEQEKARRQALVDAQRRKGLGDQDLSTGNLGSAATGTQRRAALLGQTGAEGAA